MEVYAEAARARANAEVLGQELFNHLPYWAGQLVWVLGPAPQTGHGSEKPHVSLSQVGNKAIFTIIGEENLVGGVCDCCVGSYAEVKAHAVLEIVEYTIPGIEPVRPQPWPQNHGGWR